MALDRFQLIHSDRNGNPTLPGVVGHWVRVTDYATPTPVNELSDGGQFENADCGEACVKSLLADHGIEASALTIEHDASAGAGGTSGAQLVKALADFGITAHVATGTTPAGIIMNPMGGRVLPASAFPAYARASWNSQVVIDATIDDMSAASEAQIADIWTALFELFGQPGTKWNNLESMRRGIANGTGSAYSQNSAVPFVSTYEPPAAGGTGLTATQAAAIAQIPNLVATVATLTTNVNAILAKLNKDLA